MRFRGIVRVRKEQSHIRIYFLLLTVGFIIGFFIGNLKDSQIEYKIIEFNNTIINEHNLTIIKEIEVIKYINVSGRCINYSGLIEFKDDKINKLIYQNEYLREQNTKLMSSNNSLQFDNLTNEYSKCRDKLNSSLEILNKIKELN